MHLFDDSRSRRFESLRFVILAALGVACGPGSGTTNDDGGGSSTTAVGDDDGGRDDDERAEHGGQRRRDGDGQQHGRADDDEHDHDHDDGSDHHDVGERRGQQRCAADLPARLRGPGRHPANGRGDAVGAGALRRRADPPGPGG
jgi:hypothetical protein